MTRGDMELIVGARIAEYLDIPTDDNPIALRREVWMAADYVAERTRCHHTGFSLNITAGISRYCPGNLLEVTGAIYQNSAGYYLTLPVYSRVRIDRITGGRWRSDPSAQDARSIVVMGPNAVELYPMPSVDRTAGLRLEGYYKPGKYWVYDSNGTAQDPANSDPCPLPTFAHDCVIEFALLARLRVLMVKYPKLIQAIPVIQSYANSLLGEVEASTGRYWQMAAAAPTPLWRD